MPHSPPQLILTREQLRRVDQLAVEQYRIPSILLMENAARGLAQQALAMLPEDRDRPPSVLILCGGGNNAGDGLAAARHLHNAGARPALLLTREREKYQGDAATNLEICRAMGLKIIEAGDDPVGEAERCGTHDLLIDALLGTGLTSDVREPLDRLIGWINDQSTAILAVDIPSGLDADTGRPLGAAVRADATITFVALKPGFTHPHAKPYLGEIVIGDIGAPRELAASLSQGAEHS